MKAQPKKTQQKVRSPKDIIHSTPAYSMAHAIITAMIENDECPLTLHQVVDLLGVVSLKAMMANDEAERRVALELMLDLVDEFDLLCLLKQYAPNGPIRLQIPA